MEENVNLNHLEEIDNYMNNKCLFCSKKNINLFFNINFSFINSYIFNFIFYNFFINTINKMRTLDISYQKIKMFAKNAPFQIVKNVTELKI